MQVDDRNHFLGFDGIVVGLAPVAGFTVGSMALRRQRSCVPTIYLPGASGIRLWSDAAPRDAMTA